MRPAGIPVQSATIAATTAALTSGNTTGASPLPTLHPHSLLAPGVSLRMTDTTRQSHPLQ
ncbi:hypothetical protein EVG94_20210 [Salmonella enterica subsp. enterica serovar Bovismorbificans]|nr:hypothetical protein [Salmonella enterica subsp. enterica serovar Bovismorbificans]